MGQFDADTILWDLLDRSLAGGESFFLVAQPKVGDSYIITACGAPEVHGSFDEATTSARQYLADRPEEDLEIRVRGLSSSLRARISNRELPPYTAVPTGFVDGLDYVVSSYCVPQDVAEEYRKLVEQSMELDDNPNRRDTPTERSERLLHNLNLEFEEELQQIQQQFPQYQHFAVQFGDPTWVYMTDAKEKLNVFLPHLEKRVPLVIPLVTSNR